MPDCLTYWYINDNDKSHPGKCDTHTLNYTYIKITIVTVLTGEKISKGRHCVPPLGCQAVQTINPKKSKFL